MTKQRSFKRRVRDRMNKTHESYTAARRQLLDKMTDDEPTDETSPNPTPDAGDDANSHEVQQVWSGVSARIVQQRTGRDWDEWFALLDAREATTHKHPEVAGWLVTEHGVDGWWAQSITVGYEQARGLRVVGQRNGVRARITSGRSVRLTSACRRAGSFLEHVRVQQQHTIHYGHQSTGRQPVQSLGRGTHV